MSRHFMSPQHGAHIMSDQKAEPGESAAHKGGDKADTKGKGGKHSHIHVHTHHGIAHHVHKIGEGGGSSDTFKHGDYEGVLAKVREHLGAESSTTGGDEGEGTHGGDGGRDEGQGF